MTQQAEEAWEIGPSLRRRMVWDIVACDQARNIQTKMGLTPGSDEGDKREHSMSHARLRRVNPIDKWVVLTSGIAGEVMTQAILESHGIDAESVVAKQQTKHYQDIAKATAVAVIANLLDYGVLEYGTQGITV